MRKAFANLRGLSLLETCGMAGQVGYQQAWRSCAVVAESPWLLWQHCSKIGSRLTDEDTHDHTNCLMGLPLIFTCITNIENYDAANPDANDDTTHNEDDFHGLPRDTKARDTSSTSSFFTSSFSFDEKSLCQKQGDDHKDANTPP